MPDDVSLDLDLNTILTVRLKRGEESDSVQFRINSKDGSDAEVSFDGENWIPAWKVYHAISGFSDRYPTAFEQI